MKEEKPDWSDLFEASRTGNKEAFDEICDRLTEYLMLTASSRLGGGLSAKLGASEVVQQSIQEAWQDLASFQGNSESEFRAWLVRLVLAKLTKPAEKLEQPEDSESLREAPKTPGSVIPPTSSPKSDSSIVRRLETDNELLRAVARLPDRCRKIIDLRHWQGLSFAEIGSQLEITEASARKLWMQAVVEIQKTLTDDTPTSQD